MQTALVLCMLGDSNEATSNIEWTGLSSHQPAVHFILLSTTFHISLSHRATIPAFIHSLYPYQLHPHP
eukprot:184557-Pelagomonas_calceolata.AAC.2